IVINLSPPREHARISCAVLQSGRHLFSEKPLGVSRAEAQAILAERDRTGGKAACAPGIMWGESQRALWQLAAEGAIGRVHGAFASIQWPGHERWHPNPEFFYQPGGGPVLDIGVYGLTALTTVLGPVAQVSAQQQTALPVRRIAGGPKAGQTFTSQVPDHVNALLQFASGAQGVLLASFAVARSETPSLELYGDAGALHLDDVIDFTSPVRQAAFGANDWSVAAQGGSLKGVDWARAVVDLAAAIRRGREPLCSLEHAYHVLDVMLAIHEAAAAGAPVAIASRFEPPAAPPEAGWLK
ncbi:MAG TPA: Gfo/Idh/MocA family oxidoreductase, partial [Limnochordia bacterium]|nr:Gfo/Idh/MocA family oxidoreductase [Limnochordia bacterium]